MRPLSKPIFKDETADPQYADLQREGTVLFYEHNTTLQYHFLFIFLTSKYRPVWLLRWGLMEFREISPCGYLSILREALFVMISCCLQVVPAAEGGLEREDVEFNEDFVRNIIHKVDWRALLITAGEVYFLFVLACCLTPSTVGVRGPGITRCGCC